MTPRASSARFAAEADYLANEATTILTPGGGLQVL